MRTLAGRGRGSVLSEAVAAVVVLIVLVAGFDVTERLIVCPPSGESGGGGPGFVTGGYHWECVDGQLHMLPKQGDVIVPYVNMRMAKEAGVKVPSDFDPAKTPDGWTWDEFMTMCKRLTVDANGKRGDEAGFDKDNVAVYGGWLGLSRDAIATLEEQEVI